MTSFVLRLGETLLVLGAAPAVLGLASRTRALLTGRRGTPVLQGYADLAKLMRKGAVFSEATTPAFQLSALIYVVTTLVAAALVPFDGHGALMGFEGDLLLFAGLLSAGRYALVVAAMDTGSSFEGMGASRHVMLASLIEPALFLCLMVPMRASGQLSLEGMLGSELARVWTNEAPALVMSGVCLFVLLIAEAGRVPVDDTATHLELTMIHEVMVLDHGGVDLGLIQYASAAKFTMVATLLLGVMVPRGAMAAGAALAAGAGGLALVAVAVGVVEAVTGRLRLNRVPQLLVATAMLATVAVILVLH
jgi:formate hydrogenlyase subunit 4